MKLNILFVDDESNVISGLKRMLRPLRTEWNFFFAESGLDALKILEEIKIDVIVSDMQMPNMNGAQLLEKVKDKYPSVIRFILSGHSNMELALKSTRTVHQFIAKPIEAEQLKEKISRSYKLFSLLENENLRKVINGLQTLPAIPETYFEIEQELQKEDFSLKMVAEIINKDSVMSAKILQLVNSAFFGLPANLTEIESAVNLLGANTIKTLILYVQLFASFNIDKETKNLLNEIWVHSLKVARNSKKIILAFDGNKDEVNTAYTAGLLHDIGKIVVFSNNEYRESVFEIREKLGLDYIDAEQKVMQTTHAEIGGYLLSLWGLPERIVEAVLFHHSIQNNFYYKMNVVTAVHLANSLSNYPHINMKYIKEIGLEKQLPQIIDICSK